MVYDGPMPARNALSSSRPADEKITINVAHVDLGQIDLLVQEGFYANRSDLIRTALRNQLAAHQDVVKQLLARKEVVLGIQHFEAADLKALRAAGRKLNLRVLGLASFASDITPELACATIESIQVLGALHASPAVKSALADRMP